VIEYAISEFGVKDTEKAVMVGDRKYDIEGAHAFDLKAVGVLFGYGSAEELADADYLAEDIDTLSKILL